jgi:hypothetical protein
MPAEDCAAGFAYIIVNAKEYHGQMADPFAPLMKFGLLPTTSHIKSETHGEPAIDRPTTMGLPLEKSTTCSQATEYATELKDILQTVNEEFSEMSSFAKRWGLRDFQKKTGLSIKYWLQTETDIIAKLQGLCRTRDSGDARAINILQAQLLSLKPILERLADYFRSTQKDAKGFIKDPTALSAALEALAYRERVARSLIAALEKINE